jgi:transcriptional regulator with XRE-family HTH domain
MDEMFIIKCLDCWESIRVMEKSILVKFGRKVRLERLKKNLSQEDLGARAGLHRTYIGMVERAEKNVTLRNIEKICRALDLRIRDFFKDF